MELSARAVVERSALEVFSRARDELHELFTHMPDVSRIERLQSASSLGSLERVDRLVATVSPLRLAGRSFSEARWLLLSAWHEETTSASWEVRVEHPHEAMRCDGTISIVDSGQGGATVTIAGQLSLRLEALGMRLLGPVFGRSLERMVAARVESNLASLFGAFRPV